MNGQGHNERACDCAEMLRRVGIEMTGGAGGANVMNALADKKEQQVASRRGQRYRPTRTVAQTFRQNREQGHAEERPRCQTDQRTKRFVRQAQQRSNRPAGNREAVSGADLAKRQLTVQRWAIGSCCSRQTCVSMVRWTSSACSRSRSR